MKLNIGTIIRDRRRAMDMTQEQLAERLGVTCQSVSRWENGMTYPDIEFLPLLADLFGITLDELMGHTKTAKEQRLAKLWEECETLVDPEACFDHLARIREEYPNEWVAVDEMLWLIKRYDIHKDELHALTMEVLENCADEEIRHDVTEIYLYHAEEDSITPEFLDRYTQRYDRNTLLEQRYFQRGDWEHYEELRQNNLIHQLDFIFGERLRRNYHASVVDSAWAQKTSLSIINLLTGYSSSGLSDIMDTTPDLWFPMKYWLGLRLSCALASSGQSEAALDVLESTVTLMERVFSLPIGTVLTYRSRTLDRLDSKIVSYFLKESECCVNIESERDKEKLHGVAVMAKFAVVRDVNLNRNLVWRMELAPLTERGGWEWFDPIREHPRYLACIDRMNALRETVSQYADA